jgi:hypothetical protein
MASHAFMSQRTRRRRRFQGELHGRAARLRERRRKMTRNKATPFNLLGIDRWVRNFAYLNARALRGMESDPMERFLRLRAAGETKKYLALFRDESNAMWALEKLLRERTVDLYQAYCDMNKTKTKGMRDLAYCFRPHVYALHGKYLATLPNPVPVIKDTVIAYVNELTLDEQLKLLKGPATLAPRPPASATQEAAAEAPAAAEVAAQSQDQDQGHDSEMAQYAEL